MLIEYMGVCVLNLTLGSEAKVSAYLHMVNNYLELFFFKLNQGDDPWMVFAKLFPGIKQTNK